MAAPSDPVLVVHDLRKSFAETQALCGVSLELRRGELLGLLGPNGAGKTTLVRAIAGRVRLQGGSIELLGRALAGPSGREILGVVPQDIALFARLTARENLDAFGRLNGLTGAALRDKVRWALKWTGLSERAGEPVARFSGGMRRRLNIACGVLHDPQVVLLDEPTAGVDPQSRERIYEMLDALRRGGASLLLTTHQLEEAEVRCERIVVLDHGRVVAEGTLEELIRRTLGDRRHALLYVDRAPLAPIAGLEPFDGAKVLRAELRDIAVDLPELLRAAAAAGCVVNDVEIERPTLQAVFLQLTGRELRE